MKIGDSVKVIHERRQSWFNKVGTITKVDTREGKPYLGVRFADGRPPALSNGHIVWFFEDELELIEAAKS